MILQVRKLFKLDDVLANKKTQIVEQVSFYLL